MDRFELPHHRQASQLEGVVFVGLAFDVLPPPGFFVGAADERLESQFLAQVADPTAGATGFHHHQVDLVRCVSTCRQIASVVVGRIETDVLASRCRKSSTSS